MDDSQAGYMNEEQVKALYLNAAIKAKENGFDLIDVILKMNSLDIFPQLYKPLDKLHGLIEIYRQWCINLEEAQKARDQERVKDLKRSAGNLLEELVFLAFISLRGFETAKSFRSFSAQHDLVISGKVGAWEILLNLLNLNPTHKTFLIEAKNRDEKVSDAQFSRMCTIMQLQFEQSCGLGIFVSRMGATGFPEDRRQIALREARATQILFHASTGKYIIVLDHDDILELGKDGALPQIIERKIRDIEEVSGLSDASISNLGWGEYDLPEHLAQHISVVVSDKESTTA